jgi:LacI family transcriptional regulator
MKNAISKMQVTLKDIANMTGYTVNTVSRALKDKTDISAETRIYIQECAQKLGYINNSIAGALRSGSTKTIAIILGDISNPHFALMVKEIDSVARRYKYSSIIFNTDEEPEREKDALYIALGKKVDGVIICPTQRSNANIELLNKARVPFVLMGRNYDNIESDSVVCDDVKGGFLATKYLIELGHKNILFLNGDTYISSAKNRLIGYKNALENCSIKYNVALVHTIPVTQVESLSAIMGSLEPGVRFSAVFAFSDLIAWEAIYSLNKMGYKVPGDISVVGFDNIQSKFYFYTPLTTIGVEGPKMSERAFEILREKMEHENDKCVKEVLDVSLFIRDSTQNNGSQRNNEDSNTI